MKSYNEASDGIGRIWFGCLILVPFGCSYGSKFGYLGFVRTIVHERKKSQKVLHILNSMAYSHFPQVFFVYEKHFCWEKGQHREALTGKKTTIYFIYYNGSYNSLWAKKVPKVAFYIG